MSYPTRQLRALHCLDSNSVARSDAPTPTPPPSTPVLASDQNEVSKTPQNNKDEVSSPPETSSSDQTLTAEHSSRRDSLGSPESSPNGVQNTPEAEDSKSDSTPSYVQKVDMADTLEELGFSSETAVLIETPNEVSEFSYRYVVCVCVEILCVHGGLHVCLLRAVVCLLCGLMCLFVV